jgi:hypothetical protein
MAETQTSEVAWSERVIESAVGEAAYEETTGLVGSFPAALPFSVEITA